MRSDGTRRLLEGSSVMMKLVNPESIFKCDFALVNHYQISLFLSRINYWFVVELLRSGATKRAYELHAIFWKVSNEIKTSIHVA